MIIRRFFGFCVEGIHPRELFIIQCRWMNEPSMGTARFTMASPRTSAWWGNNWVKPRTEKIASKRKEKYYFMLFPPFVNFHSWLCFFILLPCDGGKAEKDYFHSVLRDNAAEAEDGKAEKQSQSCEQSFQLFFLSSSRDVVETFVIKLVFSLI